jgi:hypothetical protein
MMFRNEQHVLVRASAIAGNHQFEIQLEKPAEMTSMSGNDDFQHCTPE